MASNTMRQAIVTRWLAPTDTKGSRVKAYCDAGSLIIPWSQEIDVAANHIKAATALAWKLGWTDRNTLHGGSLPAKCRDAYCFVLREIGT